MIFIKITDNYLKCSMQHRDLLNNQSYGTTFTYEILKLVKSKGRNDLLKYLKLT